LICSVAEIYNITTFLVLQLVQNLHAGLEARLGAVLLLELFIRLLMVLMLGSRPGVEDLRFLPAPAGGVEEAAELRGRDCGLLSLVTPPLALVVERRLPDRGLGDDDVDAVDDAGDITARLGLGDTVEPNATAGELLGPEDVDEQVRHSLSGAKSPLRVCLAFLLASFLALDLASRMSCLYTVMKDTA
jgi:hypothetical protein